MAYKVSIRLSTSPHIKAGHGNPVSMKNRVSKVRKILNPFQIFKHYPFSKARLRLSSARCFGDSPLGLCCSEAKGWRWQCQWCSRHPYCVSTQLSPCQERSRSMPVLLLGLASGWGGELLCLIEEMLCLWSRHVGIHTEEGGGQNEKLLRSKCKIISVLRAGRL